MMSHYFCPCRRPGAGRACSPAHHASCTQHLPLFHLAQSTVPRPARRPGKGGKFPERRTVGRSRLPPAFPAAPILSHPPFGTPVCPAFFGRRDCRAQSGAPSGAVLFPHRIPNAPLCSPGFPCFLFALIPRPWRDRKTRRKAPRRRACPRESCAKPRWCSCNASGRCSRRQCSRPRCRSPWRRSSACRW